MRATEFTLSEKILPKGQWELVVSSSDKADLSDNLIDVVNKAYTNAPMGSFVPTVKEVLPSDWHVIDWDENPDVDAAIFYRKPRSNEQWIGIKIQGIGHDGQSKSKQLVLDKLAALLNTNGTWIESSDALRSVLIKKPVNVVTDVNILQRLYNDPDLKMIDATTYRRKLLNGNTIIETTFGKPILKKTQ